MIVAACLLTIGVVIWSYSDAGWPFLAAMISSLHRLATARMAFSISGFMSCAFPFQFDTAIALISPRVPPFHPLAGEQFQARNITQ